MVTDLEVGMEATEDAVGSTTTEKAAMVAGREVDTSVEASQEAIASRWDDETTEIGAMAAVRQGKTTTGRQNDHMKEATTTIRAKEGTSLSDWRIASFLGGFSAFQHFTSPAYSHSALLGLGR